MHLRPDDELRADIASGVLAFAADVAQSITVEVSEGVVTLSGRVDRWSTADLIARLTRQIAGVVGVVGVVEELTFDFDDRNMLTAGTILA
ncbi:BON domain-containing protein [Actinoplanes sp. NPDC051475]|uniref:BON domain-containing protein n=1 Tax=Actinoplanes sp. NPDC051475 TaxID=3157225 RepID=UPI00344D2278